MHTRFAIRSDAVAYCNAKHRRRSSGMHNAAIRREHALYESYKTGSRTVLQHPARSINIFFHFYKCHFRHHPRS